MLIKQQFLKFQSKTSNTVRLSLMKLEKFNDGMNYNYKRNCLVMESTMSHVIVNQEPA